MSLSGVHKFLFCVAVLAAPKIAAAERFEIIDSEGFTRPVVAKFAEVPKDWRTSGRIVWDKPCSSNEYFETIFLTQSPDGLVGARIMPGYQFLEDKTALTPGTVPDQVTQLMLAQAQAFNREMASKFRGSNCAVGTLADTETIVRNVVLRNRPADTRVIAAHRDDAGLEVLRASFGTGIDGVYISYDARIIEMQYDRGGVPTTEWLYLSWYNFTQAPMDMGGVTASTSHTIVEPFRLVWAPTANARDMLPKVARIFDTIYSAPDWQEQIDELYRREGEARRRAQVERDAASDRRVRQFIDQIIWEGQSPGEGGGSTASDTASSGTDTDGREPGPLEDRERPSNGEEPSGEDRN